jgi:hypothetical protein
MGELKRGTLVGLYVAGVVMLSEGILEVTSHWDMGVWDSGQRHVILGILLVAIVVLSLRGQKKQQGNTK